MGGHVASVTPRGWEVGSDKCLGWVSHTQMRSVLWVWLSRGALSKNTWWSGRATIAQEEGRVSVKNVFKSNVSQRAIGVGRVCFVTF